MRQLPYKLFFILNDLKDFYTDKDLTKTSPYDYSYGYVFTEDDVNELVSKYGEKINFITKEDNVESGLYNVISFEDYYISVYEDIKEDFEDTYIADYDTEQVAPLITKYLQLKRIYNDLVFAVEDELQTRINEEETKGILA